MCSFDSCGQGNSDVISEDVRFDINLNYLMCIYNFFDDLTNLIGAKPIHKHVLIQYYYGKVDNDC